MRTCAHTYTHTRAHTHLTSVSECVKLRDQEGAKPSTESKGSAMYQFYGYNLVDYSAIYSNRTINVLTSV